MRAPMPIIRRLRLLPGALLLLLAVACGGPSPRAPGPPRVPPSARPELQGARLAQCLAELDTLGVRYRRLPDRVFPGGCQQIGTVQLLDAGVPVAGLGPMTCPLARAFTGWVREAVQPAARVWMSSRVTRIDSFGSYACRPVNGVAGARLSEHAYANAVDVAAFNFADGGRVTVKDGWNGANPDARDFLRATQGSGCRRFSIQLGPEANAMHSNHFHLDVGRGPYCR